MITQGSDSQKDKVHIIKQSNPNDQSNRLSQGPNLNKDQDATGEFNTSSHHLNTSISLSTPSSGSSSLSPTSINTFSPPSPILYTSSVHEPTNNKFVEAYLEVCIFL